MESEAQFPLFPPVKKPYRQLIDAAPSAMNAEFAIYDALLWEPTDGYFLLDYHLRRLERSAAHFRFPLDIDTARKALLNYA